MEKKQKALHGYVQGFFILGNSILLRSINIYFDQKRIWTS